VVRLAYDTARISSREVLEIFFTIPRPDQLNRQGNDVGTQYRSGIYFHDAAQEQRGARGAGRGEGAHGGRAVTELKPLQNYTAPRTTTSTTIANHPGEGYCAFVVGPKVEKFRKTFAQRIKP
jgi:peptide-methionine (S)-S-oxide reductase